MSPRDGRTGAAPVAELAVLESDQHHLREQADIDRRTSASFRLETRRQLEQLGIAQATTASQLARVSDLVNRLDVSVTSQTGAVQKMAGDFAEARGEARGGIKVVGALAVLVPVVLKVLEHFFR